MKIVKYVKRRYAYLPIKTLDLGWKWLKPLVKICFEFENVLGFYPQLEEKNLRIYHFIADKDNYLLWNSNLLLQNERAK